MEKDKKIKVNIGCRTKPLPTYINVDIDPDNELADRIDNGFELNTFEDGSIDLIEAVHMFEHLSYEESSTALEVWHRKLKMGGTLRLSVPDLTKLSALLLLTDEKRLVRSSLYGSQRGDQWDYHKNGHTRSSLTKDLEHHGFKDVREWSWQETWPHNYVDTFASAYWPPMRKNYKLDSGTYENLGGILMSLNLEATKTKNLYKQ
jgi:2-polyprenyl-3-methyl-5-hydroxy-6-metoxy-1,4-benzoquinol methylase